jgi:hypothetical protein
MIIEYDSWYDTTERLPLTGLSVKLYSDKTWFGDAENLPFRMRNK